MFPLEGIQYARDIIGSAPWVFVGCVSFEPRWETFVAAAEAVSLRPNISHFIFPIDDGSRWHDECLQKQESHWAKSPAKTTWKSTKADLHLFSANPSHSALEMLEDVVRRANVKAIKTLVIDFTTMPRICYLPMISRALQQSIFETILVVYTKPGDYRKGPLTSEPVDATVVPTFAPLPSPGKSKVPIGWIPILGFGPCFASKITERLTDFDMRDRVYPLIGYPAYQPTFFERVLMDSARVLLELVKSPDQFTYASAVDPYETREAILRIASSAAQDIHWIGSPMGSKPMALGMILAAQERPITMLIARPRSYHPEYSLGTGEIQVFPIRIAGRLAY